MRALVRPVSSSMHCCQLTHIPRTSIDIAKAKAQHDNYVQVLESLGCDLLWLAPEPELPDAVFVEDTAVVFDEVAVLTRPGAESRRPEVLSVAEALKVQREMFSISAPGTLDGGDVLRIGREVYVGCSTRSNSSGIAQFAVGLERFGYRVTPVPIRKCLHLKTAITLVGPGILLINDEWVDRDIWPSMQFISVAPEEPFAANALRIGDVVLHPAASLRTCERLASVGIRVLPLDISEIEKAEGGVTCLSIFLDGAHF